MYERDSASGVVRVVGRARDAKSLVVAGDHIVCGNEHGDPSFLQLPGGEERSLTGASFVRRRVETDGTAAYFGLDSSSSRGGVVALVIGHRSATSDRHYGIDTGKVDAFTVGGGEVYWMVDDTLFAEPIVPQ